MTRSSNEDPASSRSVARPVANLGNTCYMNAVLQALAHAPELCLAMDCESHRSCCPIAAENEDKLQRRSQSPESLASSHDSDSPRARATRKSRRSGAKSPAGRADLLNSTTFCALCELEEHLHSVHDSSMKDKPVAPESFVNGFIREVAPWFKLGVQEDSHEFLRLLIDAMQKSCEKARKGLHGNTDATSSQRSSKLISENVTPEKVASASPPSETWSISNTLETEYPFSLFRGTVESTVTCGSCKALSSTLDPIEDIGLEVAAPLASSTRTSSERSSRNIAPMPNGALYDVEAAFSRFSQPECLDSGYKCEKCGKVGKATKQSRLASIPPILTLHLKRFRYGGGGGVSGSGETTARRATARSELGQLLAGSDLYGKSGSAKIEGHVKFKVLFDLKPFLTEELQKKHAGHMLCKLFAVVVHAGKNSHSGHYIAYVRHFKKNEWWKMDDGRVTLVSQDELLRAEAYMLFYRVMQHPVATRLEREYKLKIKESKSLANNRCSDPSESHVINTFVAPKNRKRAMEERCTSGEDWVRFKTKMPPHLLKVVRAIEEAVSDENTIVPEAIRSILKEQGDGNNFTEPVNESGIFGDVEKIRSGIVYPAIWEVARWIEKNTGTTAEDWLRPPPKSTPTLDAIPDDKLVAVVEPEEEMNLL